MLGYIGIDQHGQTYQIGDNPPRKWLLNHLDRQHAGKMYIDRKDGKSYHIGYIIAGLWIQVYEIHDWAKAA